jgi:hypothetical protein
MRLKNRSIFFLSTLLSASLACTIFVGGPDYPAQIISPSPDEVTNMQAQIEKAYTAGAETGIVTLQITESQLTSYLALKTQEQVNPPFTDPQILLRNGQMKLYGKIAQGVFVANMLITMNVGIDSTTSLPNITIATADFGPFNAPAGLNDAISKLITEAFTGSLGPVATGIRIESVSIADGVISLIGRIK